jgi:hypothetical protein
VIKDQRSKNSRMEKEDLNTESLEKIRLKYRKEAITAIAEAEKKGYEKGKSESFLEQQEEVKKWKAIAEAVESNDSGSSKPTVLIKFIMEQVYKDMKKEFGDTKDVVLKLKVCIIYILLFIILYLNVTFILHFLLLDFCLNNLYRMF